MNGVVGLRDDGSTGSRKEKIPASGGFGGGGVNGRRRSFGVEVTEFVDDVVQGERILAIGPQPGPIVPEPIRVGDSTMFFQVI